MLQRRRVFESLKLVGKKVEDERKKDLLIIQMYLLTNYPVFLYNHGAKA
jgi:hypothetical protein